MRSIGYTIGNALMLVGTFFFMWADDGFAYAWRAIRHPFPELTK